MYLGSVYPGCICLPVYLPGYTQHAAHSTTTAARLPARVQLTALTRVVAELTVRHIPLTVTTTVSLLDTRFTVGLSFPFHPISQKNTVGRGPLCAKSSLRPSDR